jgi:hypothetical protein
VLNQQVRQDHRASSWGIRFPRSKSAQPFTGSLRAWPTRRLG